MTDGLLIRCDASTQIGLGHLMRCLALAECLRDLGVRAEFATGKMSAFAGDTLEASGFRSHLLSDAERGFDRTAAESVLALMSNCGFESILVDHYDAGTEYFQTLADRCHIVCAIDDQAIRNFSRVDWILNPNPGVEAREYNVSDDSDVLIGSEYALIRRQFLELRNSKRASRNGDRLRVLIQFGGSDTSEVCHRVLRWFNRVSSPCSIRCIIADQQDDAAKVHESDVHDIATFSNVQNVAAHMQWADIAIGAGGSSCWELCCLGVPMIIGELSPDQARIAQKLNGKGAAIHLGHWNQVGESQFVEAVYRLTNDESHREQMGSVGRQLVDGQGAIRAAQSITKKLRAKQEMPT
ncbi:MAG: UDP-2,4-diacetamido-2,4,6-trideoxy-beta-L-altropy ranose hydrolase [Phycisphaerae bacterium]|nr:MAG: UDP-2,4-diacetamido-2,4,6-trideoxy-beta-L-altropy ranose hydrolase [Phycisphaerae bacterium]